jgi:hypothetical protein
MDDCSMGTKSRFRTVVPAVDNGSRGGAVPVGDQSRCGTAAKAMGKEGSLPKKALRGEAAKKARWGERFHNAYVSAILFKRSYVMWLRTGAMRGSVGCIFMLGCPVLYARTVPHKYGSSN